ncbi:uncharacterized protein N7482_005679 [Penicillium canariense]|uniref:Acyl-CoA thioesterase-like C-terminal domain-containing protein n=1 Tax=Penicillium canariense TaxID=189055 RepID=A0A9W9LNP1_9EURO|nr:uncharacterized protein N7482_005679 [Penicillium canariense]KAJ5166898.1 hypothetical protein N7482_005679 [Penicillium canariense]
MSSAGGTDGDWEELTSPLSFVELMALKRLGDTEKSHASINEPERIERFRSLAAPFPPGEGNRSFGGHVYAQSAYAASKTVGTGFVVHNMTGTFIRGGRLDIPVDADWWIETVQREGIDEREFPGLDVRKVDMKDYNQSKSIREQPEKYRQLTQYRLKGLPDEDPKATSAQIREREARGEYDNLYACAHMYSSDKNSLLLIPRALGIKYWAEMSSLTLTVIIHQHGEALRMIDWDAMPGDKTSLVPMKWFIQEGWTPQSAESRAVHESHLWSPDGTLIATSLQDSLLRLRKAERSGNL